MVYILHIKKQNTKNFEDILSSDIQTIPVLRLHVLFQTWMSVVLRQWQLWQWDCDHVDLSWLKVHWGAETSRLLSDTLCFSVRWQEAAITVRKKLITATKPLKPPHETRTHISSNHLIKVTSVEKTHRERRH